MPFFTDLVRSRRAELGMTALQLSYAANVPVSLITRIEAGKGCRIDTALKLSKALGLQNIPVE